jgi:hypothetical protein
MTKVTIHTGICGFSVIITAEKVKNKKIKISLDTECEMVMNMLEDVSLLDVLALFTNHLNNPVYRSAAKHLKHVTCPVTVGILKAAEVEAELALPKDVSIKFSKDEEVIIYENRNKS